jgi:GAF domain-containing protein
VPSLSLRKRTFKTAPQTETLRLKPKLVVLDPTRTQAPGIHPVQDELDSALRQATEQTGASGAAIALGTGAADLYCRATCGMAPPVGTFIDPDAGLTGLGFRTGKVLLCRDTEEDSRVDAAACRALSVRSVLVVPLIKEGASCGIMELFSPLSETFS